MELMKCQKVKRLPAYIARNYYNIPTLRI